MEEKREVAGGFKLFYFYLLIEQKLLEYLLVILIYKFLSIPFHKGMELNQKTLNRWHFLHLDSGVDFINPFTTLR